MRDGRGSVALFGFFSRAASCCRGAEIALFNAVQVSGTTVPVTGLQLALAWGDDATGGVAIQDGTGRDAPMHSAEPGG